MTEKTRGPEDGASRRDFLTLAGLGTATAAAALATGDTAEAGAAPDTGSGYRETDHIRRYYDTARF